MPALTDETTSGTFHGVHIIDDEHGAIAATRDPRRAFVALDAFYRHTSGEGLKDWRVGVGDLIQGWGWFEDKSDGPWHYCSVDRPDRPDVFPATWLPL